MTLPELIAQLAAATDGAAEDESSRRIHPLFPSITITRVSFQKRYPMEIEISEQEVLVENIDTPEEAAFYNKGRVPRPVLESLDVPVPFLFTAKEIKDAVSKAGFKIVNKRNEDDHMIVDGYIDDPQTPTEKVLVTSWYIFKTGQTILAKRIG